MHRRLAALSLATLLGVACSSSTPEPTAAADAGRTDFKHDVVLSMSLKVPAGSELHQCQFVQVPAGADLNLVRLAHQYTPGSHHFLIYETDLTSIPPEMNGQYDCTWGDEPIMSHTRGIMYAGQSSKAEFAFPPGVAFPLKAGAVLMFQSHYINANTKDIDATVDFGMDSAPAETVKEKAGFFIFYDPFIYLPPASKTTSGIRCPIPSNIKVLTGVTHYHQRGTGMKVYVDPPNAPPATTPFFETSDWQHPPDFAGPLEIAAGSKVRFNCEYDNSGANEEIFQGPNAKTSEMCVFAGLYYPVPEDAKFEVCNPPSIVGTGDNACFNIASCIQSCAAEDAPVRTWGGVKVGACWERCIAKGCDGAFDTFIPLAVCSSQNCKAECAAGKCLSCMYEKCSAQVDTCSTHVCAK